jgi:hypothetical protein
MNTTAPVIVFGESSASVFLIHELTKKNESVLWVNGSGNRLIPVMPYVKSEKALGTLLAAQNSLDAEPYARPLERGTFHRVFRNKAFKFPVWKRAASLQSQEESFSEMVWIPEQAFLGVQEFRMGGLTPVQIENELRVRFETHELVKKVQNTPIVEFEVFEHGGKIQFANGLITEFKQFYFCDSLNELRTIPKLTSVFKHPLSGVKSSNQMNALQVIFHHSVAMTQSTDVGFVVPLNRDSGETFDRDVLGYFLDDRTSVWTVFLQHSECEENHDIMKKLRKLKQSLNRAFDSPEFLTEGKKDFLATVEKEQFRFEENCIMTEGEFKTSKSNPDFVLLPDSFGLSKTLEAIADRFEIQSIEFSAFETEGTNAQAAIVDEAAVDESSEAEVDVSETHSVGPETNSGSPNL